MPHIDDDLLARLKAERAAFQRSYPHLDFSEKDDAWNTHIYIHSHVQALWDGWRDRAFSQQPLLDPPVDADLLLAEEIYKATYLRGDPIVSILEAIRGARKLEAEECARIAEDSSTIIGPEIAAVIRQRSADHG